MQDHLHSLTPDDRQQIDAAQVRAREIMTEIARKWCELRIAVERIVADKKHATLVKGYAEADVALTELWDAMGGLEHVEAVQQQVAAEQAETVETPQTETEMVEAKRPKKAAAK